MIKKTVIITGYQCNNNCVFCCNLHKRDIPNKDTLIIMKEIAAARERGTTYMEIIGGEQTMRSDIIDIVRFAHTLGFRTIAMATNGRMFSYPDFASQIIAAGLNHLIFSIHGHDASSHDALTRVRGSFRQLLQGVKNVQRLKVKKLGANTTIVKQNYKSLPKIGKFIYGLGIRNAEFIFVDPNAGGARADFKGLVPRISDAAPYIKKCLDVHRNCSPDHWNVRYVPFCHFVGYESQISEWDEVKRFKTEHIAPDFRNFDVAAGRASIGRMKVQRCEKCFYADVCEGIWKPYISYFGDAELQPVIRTGPAKLSKP